MSNSNNIKPIIINPDLLNIKKKEKKQQNVKNKTIKSSELKKNLLDRIKNYKKEKLNISRELKNNKPIINNPTQKKILYK